MRKLPAQERWQTELDADKHTDNRINLRQRLKENRIASHWQLVQLKDLPRRVAKYEANLRESSLRAVQAMHTILSRMVLFECNDCNERFPTFHPAYVPPPSITKDMELFRRRKDQLPACCVEVSKWDELPPLDAPDGLARKYSGTCLRCQRDMDEQRKLLGPGAGSHDIIALRSEENHMDPLFRFPQGPEHDLRELFSHATLVETMLVALDHMQVNFVSVHRNGLRKFRRNTLSFPQDISTFAQRMDLMKNYEVNDRVNSFRGVFPGSDPRDPDREVRKATSSTPQDREKYAVDFLGNLIIPGKVIERFADGKLLVQYDNGLEGIEWAHNVQPRLVMPWHPKHVPLHIMLRRNVGRGKGVLEGLQVRWRYVSNLLQALCALPPGRTQWRLGGGSHEPMLKYHDRRLFYLMSEDEIERFRTEGRCWYCDACRGGSGAYARRQGGPCRGCDVGVAFYGVWLRCDVPGCRGGRR